MTRAVAARDCRLKNFHADQQMHVLLVSVHAYPSPQAVPLAAACLTAAVSAHRFSGARPRVTLIDLFCDDSPAAMLAAVCAAQPHLVGFSLSAWNRTDCVALAAALRRETPDIILCAGGPEATADPERLLADGIFDFLVVGEGEETFCTALECLITGADLAAVSGVALLRAGRVQMISRPPMGDLGSVPSPWLTGILDGHIPAGVLWELSRGCPFGCQFCFDGRGDRTVRPISLERLAAELDYFVAHGVNQVVVLDSTFNLDRQRAKEILRLIRRKAPQVHFHFEARVELLDRELARLFASTTCSLQLGLQTADPAISAAVGRPLDRRVFSEKISELNRAGVIFGFDILYGLPGDSLVSFRETLDFSLGLYPNSLAIFPLAVLPGTELAHRAVELGLRHQTEPPYLLIDSPSFPENDLSAAQQLAGACDLFYSRGKAVAWFNSIIKALGLSPSEFLMEFSRWLSGAANGGGYEVEGADQEIIVQQRRFLTKVFQRYNAVRLLPAALDYVNYHGAYSAALLASPPRMLEARQLAKIDCLKRPLRLASSTQLVSFSYDILELLACGEPDLRTVVTRFRPSASHAVIYPYDGQVMTESLAKPYASLLRRLDGTTPANGLLSGLSLSRVDAREFLDLALAEGIVVPS